MMVKDEVVAWLAMGTLVQVGVLTVDAMFGTTLKGRFVLRSVWSLLLLWLKMKGLLFPRWMITPFLPVPVTSRLTTPLRDKARLVVPPLIHTPLVAGGVNLRRCGLVRQLQTMILVCLRILWFCRASRWQLLGLVLARQMTLPTERILPTGWDDV